MSFNLKEILSELARTVGREHLLEHISVLPMAGAEDAGETAAEREAKNNPLNAEEEALLAKLQARQQTSQPAPESADGKEEDKSGNAQG